MAEGKKLKDSTKLCLYCAVRMEDGYELEPVGPVTLGTCGWCGKQTIVREFWAWKKRTRPEGRAGNVYFCVKERG